MKRMIFNKKRCYYSIPILAAAYATGLGIRSVAAANVTNTLINGGSTALDNPANWSLGTVPSPTNDALIQSPYPPAATNLVLNVGAGNLSFGSLNNTDSNGYYQYVEGGPVNASSYTLTLGGTGSSTNNLAPSGTDLLYTASNAYLDFYAGGTTTTYGKLSLVIGKSGTFDTVGGVYINAVLAGGSTSTVLTKTGTGFLDLNIGNSTYTGTWNISAGTFGVSGGGALGVAQSSVPEVVFTGNSEFSIISTTGFGNTRNFAIDAGVTATFDNTLTYNASIGGVITNGANGSGGSLLKQDTGVLTMAGALNYSGSTTVTGGTLLLSAVNNYGGSTNAYGGGILSLNVNGSIPATTVLNLSGAGGGIFSLVAGHTLNQSFGAVNLLNGNANISAPSFNVSGLTLALGSVNRSAGATVDLNLPTTGSLTLLNTNGNYTATGGQNTIIGGWATLSNQSTWAVSTSNGTTPASPTGLTNFDQTFGTPGADVDVVGTTNLNPTVSAINSLRFNDGGSYSITLSSSLTVASGGILETNNVGSGSDMISGGSLTSGNGQDLIITQADTSNILQIYSSIVDAPSGSIGLTTAGAGELLLLGSNTFTGPTYIGTGKVELVNQNALVNSTLAGGTVSFFQGITNFTIGNIGTNSNISLVDSGGSAVNLTFGGNNQNTNFSGIFTGAGSLIKVGTGLTYLSDANSTFTGGFTIAGGGIEFASGAAFGISNSSITNMVTIDNGAYIQYIAAGVSNFGSARGFILGGGDDIIQVGSTTNTSTSSLTIGASNNTGGILAAPTSGTTTATLDKEGLGTLIINTASTYNGGTNVGGGTIVAYRFGSLGVYSIPSNPSYTGNGPLNIIPTSQSATVDLEAVSPQISSLSNYIGANASGGTANLVLGFPAVSSPTTVTIGADNTSTFFSGNISDLSANYSGTVGSIIKVGTGILTLSGSDSYTGTTNVSAGTLALASLTALPANSNLTIGSGATTFLANASAGVFALSLSTLSNSGLLDVGRNGLVIRTGSTLAGISSQISQNFNGGAWNGATGITSSVAAADPKHLTAVGVIINDNGSGTALTGLFEGANTTDGDILVKYTYYGDANLDGKVDGSDYSRIDASYEAEQTPHAPQVSGWFNGDFNYDGVVDGSDYTLIDNAFNSQNTIYASELFAPTATSTAELAAVPEPATLSLITLGTVGLLGSRRRRNSTGLTRAK